MADRWWGIIVKENVNISIENDVGGAKKKVNTKKKEEIKNSFIKCTWRRRRPLCRRRDAAVDEQARAEDVGARGHR